MFRAARRPDVFFSSRGLLLVLADNALAGPARCSRPNSDRVFLYTLVKKKKNSENGKFNTDAVENDAKIIIIIIRRTRSIYTNILRTVYKCDLHGHLNDCCLSDWGGEGG